MAVEARKLEMQFFRSMKKVYDEVPRYGRTRWLQGYYDEVAGHQQRRPAEPELQGQVGRQGDQDGLSIGLVCRHPSIGVPRMICSVCTSNQDRQILTR